MTEFITLIFCCAILCNKYALTFFRAFEETGRDGEKRAVCKECSQGNVCAVSDNEVWSGRRQTSWHRTNSSEVEIDEKLAQRNALPPGRGKNLIGQKIDQSKNWITTNTIMEVGNQKMVTHSNRHEFYFPSANQTFFDESESESCNPNSQSHFLTILDHISGSSCYLDADREELHNKLSDMSESLRENSLTQFSVLILDLFLNFTGWAHA